MIESFQRRTKISAFGRYDMGIALKILTKIIRSPRVLFSKDPADYYEFIGRDIVMGMDAGREDDPTWLNLGYWEQARTYPEAAAALRLGDDDAVDVEVVDVARLEEAVVLTLVLGTGREGEHEPDERVVSVHAEGERRERDEGRELAHGRDRNRGSGGIVERLQRRCVVRGKRPDPIFRGGVAAAKSGHNRSA